MASSSTLSLSPLSSATTADTRELSSLLRSSTLLLPSNPRKNVLRRCRFKSPVAKKSFDHIPKQFREENLKDGLMDNYKNTPRYLYGLTPSQMDMFVTEDNPVDRQAGKVTEETISSSWNYLNNGELWSMSGITNNGPSKYSMSVSMYRGGGRAYGPRSSPPDLPSLLLDSRIVYLGMPIMPAVTELIVAQFMWLDYDSTTKPIYLYINSSGTQNEMNETIAAETDAFAIADAMSMCKADVYTVNLAMAYGQAGMLLSLGKKGYRGLQANCSTKLYLPSIYRSSGSATDMWIKAKELDANKDSYLELLSRGTGKPKEVLEKDISRPKYLHPQAAIDYCVADKIIKPQDTFFEKRNYDELLAQSRAKRQGQASPLGFEVKK